MDLFFEIWLILKNDFFLWRIVRISLEDGISFKIFSGDDLVVYVQQDDLNTEIAYLTAALRLVEWAERNWNHAKSSTRKEDSDKWMNKLKEQLGVSDEIDNASEGWDMLSVHASS